MYEVMPAPPLARSRPQPAGDLPASTPLPAAPDEAFDRLARLAQAQLHVPMALVTFVSVEEQVAPGGVGIRPEVQESRRFDLRESFCQTVVRSGMPMAWEDVRKVLELAEVVEAADGVVAYAGSPVRGADGRVAGAVCAVDKVARSWTDEELMLLDDLAAAASSELSLRQVLEERRQVTRSLQDAMVAPVVSPRGLEVRVLSTPLADSDPVGGDWCDVVVPDRRGLPVGPEGSVVPAVLVLGDVMGHDARAAGAMGQLRAMVRTTAWSFPHDGPAAVLDRVDRAMAGLGLQTMATCVVARVERSATGRRRLRWSSAGHLPPLLLHPGGTAELLLRPGGVPLGVMPSVERHEHVVDLPEGAGVLLYSDGLVERRDRSISDSLHDLERSATERSGQSLADLLDGLVHDLAGEEGDGGRVPDDVAALAVRVTG